MAQDFDPYHRWLGISPKHQPPDHYRLLGIERFESDPEVIRDAAQQRMAHVRTYQLGQYVELSQKILNELGVAKACLSNPDAKAAYDQVLQKLLASSQPLSASPSVPDSLDFLTVPATTSTAASKSKQSSPTSRIWLALAIFGAAVVVFAVVLVMFGRGGREVALPEPASVSRATNQTGNKTTIPEAKVIITPQKNVEPKKEPKAEAKPEPKPPASVVPKVEPKVERKTEPVTLNSPSSVTTNELATGQKEISFDLGSGVNLEMVLIPAGSFLMGDKNNKPIHKVNITKPFYLGKYEVTQEQWEAVIGNNPSHFKRPKNPVENVNLKDCQQFLGKLNETSQREGGMFQLPTEAQWEYACRAGSTTRYYYGDDDSRFGEYAWHKDNSGGMTHPVGQKKPNAWGLYDMHGNVWEKCQDWYDAEYYAVSPTDDPKGPVSGSYHVVRGGFSGDWPGRTCSASRLWYAPDRRVPDIGFRVALVSAEPLAEKPTPESDLSLKIHPVPPQTIEAGKRLSIAMTVEDADEWKGKLRYSLGPKPPLGARVEPETGTFSWTPIIAQVGKHDVNISVEDSEKRAAQTTFTVTVATSSPIKHKEITVPLARNVNLEMVLIPAGEFMMGSTPEEVAWALSEGKKNERHPDAVARIPSASPRHRVRITKSFYLGKYLVTQEQWQAVMGNNPSQFKGPKNPVEMVSWSDCQEFLATLNAKFRHEGGIFQLPTEAQWEYACRAGSTTKWCFGDEQSSIGDYAWYEKNSGNKTHPVGQKRPNAWGLYDMYGNVAQWCADWYGSDYYANSPTDDPAGPSTGSGRVMRNGSWYHAAWACLSAYRRDLAHGRRLHDLGFRVALVSAEPPTKTPEPTTPFNVQSVSPQTLAKSGPTKKSVPIKLKEITIPLARNVNLEMVLIPAGSFMMGDQKNKPIHKVNITKPFYLGKYEVTQEQWEAVMGKNPRSRFKDPKNPVDIMSWNKCQPFLATLNAKSRPGEGMFRLPTEAEWEYACRAGSTTKWYFGDEESSLGEYAWYSENSGNTTHPVGQKKPNAWGLYDMYGNVWEKCQDWFDAEYYAASPVDDPKGPDSGSKRVIRGGAIGHVPWSALRGAENPGALFVNTGFRVARTY